MVLFPSLGFRLRDTNPNRTVNAKKKYPYVQILRTLRVEFSIQGLWLIWDFGMFRVCAFEFRRLDSFEFGGVYGLEFRSRVQNIG